MAKSVSVEVTGVRDAEKFLKNSLKKVEKKSVAGLTKSTILLQGEIKASIAGRRAEHVSVDTGRFLNSVDFRIGKTDAIVFSAVPYAKKLEYGTDFRNSPRRHFRNSSARMKGPIAKLMESEIKKA